MSANGLLFDATGFAPKEKRGVLPQNTYRLQVTGCEKKATKANDGFLLAFEFTVMDGEFADRKLWVNFNLWNKSAEAVRLAQGEIGELCQAIGILQPKAESDFLGRTVVGKVKVTLRRDNKEPQNVVSEYSVDAGPGVDAPVAATPAAKGATPRWAKPASAA